MRKPAILPLGKILQKYWTFSVPLCFFALLIIFLPFRQAFWMDSDEGINLMKAQMLLRGYSLYSEIWSDQPPLLTYLLAGLFSLLGARENAGRILVLIFSSEYSRSMATGKQRRWDLPSARTDTTLRPIRRSE